MENQYLEKMYNELTSKRDELISELKQVEEARDVILSITLKENKKSPKINQINQAGKDTINQAQHTKSKIIKFIKSNGKCKMSDIINNVKKPDGTKYALNSIKTYVYELNKMRKITRVKESKNKSYYTIHYVKN